VSGSVAEERLRAAAEVRLRLRFPDARIVHELKLDDGLVRIDLAAVCPDNIVLVEIKSERDTLTRLGVQLEACGRIGAQTWLVTADKWREPLLRLARHTTGDEEDVFRKGVSIGRRSVPNPAHIRALNRTLVLFEEAEGLVEGGYPFAVQWQMDRPRILDSKRLLRLLWADELRVLAARSRIGVGPREPRDPCIRLLHEMLTGREVRRGVCAALRERPFARADEVRASA